MSNIEIKNVTLAYRPVKGEAFSYIEDLSLEFSEGEVTGICTPVAGGDLLFNALCFNDEVAVFQKGSIVTNGVFSKVFLPNRFSPEFEKISRMSVIDFMSDGYKKTFSKEELRSRAINQAEKMEVNEYLERQLKALSGFQFFRVCLAKALIKEPTRIFISGVDINFVRPMMEEIILRMKQEGITLVFLFDNLAQGLKLSDKVVLFQNGKLAMFDTPENVMKSDDDYIKRLLVNNYII